MSARAAHCLRGGREGRDRRAKGATGQASSRRSEYHAEVTDVLAPRVGLASDLDPARKPARLEAWSQNGSLANRVTIEDARRAGIITVLINGDHPATVRAIESQVGVRASDHAITNDVVVTGTQIARSGSHDGRWRQRRTALRRAESVRPWDTKQPAPQAQGRTALHSGT